jgi:hypothetical protein
VADLTTRCAGRSVRHPLGAKVTDLYVAHMISEPVQHELLVVHGRLCVPGSTEADVLVDRVEQPDVFTFHDTSTGIPFRWCRWRTTTAQYEACGGLSSTKILRLIAALSGFASGFEWE